MAIHKFNKLLPKKHKKVLKVKRIAESKTDRLKTCILKKLSKLETKFSKTEVNTVKTNSAQINRSLDKNVMLKAIGALKSIHQQHQENETKKNILSDPEDSSIFLQVTMEKIPLAKFKKMIRMKLPHPLLGESSEVCLIIGDSDKVNRRAPVEDDVLRFKTILSGLGITQITEVMSLRQLRTEYKMFEARRKLLGAYDVFLADERIIATLPRVLGRSFFQKRKFPLGLSLKTINLKERIEHTLSKAVFYLSCTGNTCSSIVAKVSMQDQNIYENISVCLKSLVKNIPGQWRNIRKLDIKMARSMSVPIYVAYLDPNKVHIPIPEQMRPDIVEEELSTLPDASVRVLPDLSVVVRNNEIKDDSKLPVSNALGKLKRKKFKRKDKSGERLSKVDGKQPEGDDDGQDNSHSLKVVKTLKKDKHKTKKKLPKLLKDVLRSEDDDEKMSHMKTSFKAKMFQGHEAEAFRNKFNEVYGPKKGDSNPDQKRKVEESKDAKRKQAKKSENVFKFARKPEKVARKTEIPGAKQQLHAKKSKNVSKFARKTEIPGKKQQLHAKKSKNVIKLARKTEVAGAKQEFKAKKEKASVIAGKMSNTNQAFCPKKNKIAVKQEFTSKKIKNVKFA